MKWPTQLILVRHGESRYNQLKLQKDADPEYQTFKKDFSREMDKLYKDFQNGILPDNLSVSQELQEMAKKFFKKYPTLKSDPETPLSDSGKEQAKFTGQGMAKTFSLPDVIFVSPYERAKETLEGITHGWPELQSVRVITDERIRERNIGILESYNDWRVLNSVKPKHGLLHRLQGKFYYRYPQGESMVDVQSRNRQWFQTLTRDWFGKKVLVVSHHLTILSIRSLLERWTPEQFIYTDENEVPKNCSLTIYRGDPTQGEDGKLILEEYNKIFY